MLELEQRSGQSLQSGLHRQKPLFKDEWLDSRRDMELFDVLGPLAEDNPLISNSGTSAFCRFVQQVSIRSILKPTIPLLPMGLETQAKRAGSKQKSPQWDWKLAVRGQFGPGRHCRTGLSGLHATGSFPNQYILHTSY